MSVIGLGFNDIAESVSMVLKANKVPFIMGHAGIGKTAIAESIAKENGWELVSISGSQLKEGELKLI